MDPGILACRRPRLNDRRRLTFVHRPCARRTLVIRQPSTHAVCDRAFPVTAYRLHTLHYTVYVGLADITSTITAAYLITFSKQQPSVSIPLRAHVYDLAVYFSWAPHPPHPVCLASQMCDFLTICRLQRFSSAGTVLLYLRYFHGRPRCRLRNCTLDCSVSCFLQ